MVYILLLISHLLADFVFQDSKLVRRKKVEHAALIEHSAIYAACILVALIITQKISIAVISTIVIGLLHYIIDRSKCIISKNIIGAKGDFVVFWIDQIIHIAFLMYISKKFLYVNAYPNTLIGQVLDMYSYDTTMKVTIIIFLYILCTCPVGVVIKKVFTMLDAQFDEQCQQEYKIVNAGFLIGILERLIILTLGLLGQFGAIALVIAAKGLARFEQLKNQDFAEKYLIGTLFSMLIALGCVYAANIIFELPVVHLNK